MRLWILHVWLGFAASWVVTAEDSSCEEFAGKRLSAWQIAKKALWDRVRGASLEISMQEGALMQLSVEVEGIPGAAQDCPLGMLSIQLFLLDMLRVLPKSGGQSLGYWHAFLGFLNLFSWIETFGGG